MAIYQLYREQRLSADPDKIWDFVSSPENLKYITPDYMGFDITTRHLKERMHAGMIISYTVAPVFGIKMKWVTEITHLVDKTYFVDEQRMGPFKFWHHQHMIRPLDKGVLMTDLVTYRPPFGILGALANRLLIRKRLGKIFEYRMKKLDQIFGGLPQPGILA